MSKFQKGALYVFTAVLVSLQLGAGCKKSSDDDDGPVFTPSSFLAFVVQPTSTTPAAIIAPSMTVEIRDGSGTLIATATNTVTLAIQNNPGGATLGGTLSRAAVAGIATFDDITVSAAGTGYTLSASAATFTGAVSAAFNIASTAATQIVVTQEPPASVAPYEAFSVVAEIRNAQGAVDTSFNGAVTIALGAQPAGDWLVHASGLGTPILEWIDAASPAVDAPITPTFALGEVFGMVYDPSIRLIRVTNLSNEFCLLDPVTGDCAVYGGVGSTNESFKGVAFNGMGQIRALTPYASTTHTIDLTTGVDSALGVSLTLSGFTVAGCTGLARHPSTGVFYAVLNESTGGFSGRPLVTVNMGTGECTLIGDTGESVAGLTFAPDGTLYAVTGDGSVTPETLWTVDLSDGSLTSILALGNGNDGESIAYMPRRLNGTLTVNAVNGIATFAGLSIDRLGSGYTLTLSSSGLASDTTSAIDVTGAVSPSATVEFPTPSSVVDENVSGGLATVTIQLSAPEAHDVPVMIYIDAASSTAAALDDHTQPLAFQVIVPAGQATVDFTIPIVDDATFEGDEDIILVISGASLSAGIGSNAIHTLSILNDD